MLVLLVCPVTPSAVAGGNLAAPGEASHIKHRRLESHVDCAVCLLPAGIQVGRGFGLILLGEDDPLRRCRCTDENDGKDLHKGYRVNVGSTVILD